MLNKISGLARIVAIVLAIVAAFVAIPNVDLALVLVVLGIIAGTTMPREMQLPSMAALLVYPIVGAALGHIPTIGEHLTTMTGNLQTALAGGIASAIAMRLYDNLKMSFGAVTGGAS